MDSIDFLDAVRDQCDIKSDNLLAEYLEIDRAQISQYRTGRRKLTVRDGVKVAHALHLEPGYVLALVQAERTKRPEDRAIWEHVAAALRGATTVVLLGFLGMASNPAEAASDSNFSASNMYYTQ